MHPHVRPAEEGGCLRRVGVSPPFHLTVCSSPPPPGVPDSGEVRQGSEPVEARKVPTTRQFPDSSGGARR
jgi:hypothetical protein